MGHIDYRVRISRRARYARIVVRPDMSVEVVLPGSVLLLSYRRKSVGGAITEAFWRAGTARKAFIPLPLFSISLEFMEMTMALSCRRLWCAIYAA